MIEKDFLIRGQQIHVKMTGDDSLPVIVFLHGFTGSTSTWTEIMESLKGKFKMVAVDLTGHGKTEAPNNFNRYIMEEQVEDLACLFKKINLQSFSLVGYSMGGRVAIAYTVTYPEQVKTLLLESTSPGLKTEEERQERRKNDQRLAQKIKVQGIPKFVDFWENIPLFASQKKMSVERQKVVRKERLKQREVGLANSLIGIGTGSQPSYWEGIKKIDMPVLLLTGEIDKKFVFIAQEMKTKINSAEHETIKNAGHAIHVEKPTLFATMVEEHVKNREIREDLN